MSEKPDTRVTIGPKARPKLVIFDDDAILLAGFAKQYTQSGYDVTPVLVPGSEHEALVANGKIIQGETIALDPYEEPKHRDPKRTVADELEHAREEFKYNKTPYYAKRVQYFEAMQSFERGAKTPEEVRAILQELKPDCVLSDNQMRLPGEVSKETVIMGGDIMRIAAETVPNAPRAIHTSLYSFFNDDDYQNFADNPDSMDMYRADIEKARRGGYGLIGKQSFREDADPRIDAYFRAGLAGATQRLDLDPLQR